MLLPCEESIVAVAWKVAASLLRKVSSTERDLVTSHSTPT